MQVIAKTTRLMDALDASGCSAMLKGLSFVLEGKADGSTFRPTPSILAAPVAGYACRKDRTAFVGVLEVSQGLYCVEIRMVHNDPLDENDDPEATFIAQPMTGYRRVQFSYFKEKLSDPDWTGLLDEERVEIRTIMNTGRVAVAAGQALTETELRMSMPRLAPRRRLDGVWDKPQPFGEKESWLEGAKAFSATDGACFKWRAFLRATEQDSDANYYDLWLSEDWPYMAQYKAARVDTRWDVKKGVAGEFVMAGVFGNYESVPKALQWFENTMDHQDSLDVSPRSLGPIFGVLLKDVLKVLLCDRQFLAYKPCVGRGIAILSRKRQDTMLYINKFIPANRSSALEHSWEGLKGSKITYADMAMDTWGGPLTWMIDGPLKAYTLDELRIKGVAEIIE